MNDPTIVVAGATGNLGGRIIRSLRERGANVRALVRPNTAPDRLDPLQKLGAELAEVDLNNASAVTPACSGASCVVSALAGLRDVIVETQSSLLGAAVKAGVPLDPSTPRFLRIAGDQLSARDLLDGRAKLAPLDNTRYPGIHWTTARDVLSASQAA